MTFDENGFGEGKCPEAKDRARSAAAHISIPNGAKLIFQFSVFQGESLGDLLCHFSLIL